MSKAAALQNALSGGMKASPPIAEPKAAEAGRGNLNRQANRADKWNMSAWLSLDFKKNLRLVQIQEDRTQQALIGEAMNLLFEKYNVPIVRE